MPKLDHYTAEVTVSVRLRSHSTGVVAEYTLTRKAEGSSAPLGETLPAQNMSAVVERAMVEVTSAEKAMRSGMQGAEGKRLK